MPDRRYKRKSAKSKPSDNDEKRHVVGFNRQILYFFRKKRQAEKRVTLIDRKTAHFDVIHHEPEHHRRDGKVSEKRHDRLLLVPEYQRDYSRKNLKNNDN